MLSACAQCFLKAGLPSRSAMTSHARGKRFTQSTCLGMLLAVLSYSGQADGMRAERCAWKKMCSGEAVGSSPGSWHIHRNPTCFTSEQILVDAIDGTLLASGGSPCSTGSRTPCKTSTAERASRSTPPILGTSTSRGDVRLVAWRAMGRPQVNEPGQNVGAHESDRAPEIGREMDARSTCANRPSQAETESGLSSSDFGNWTIERSLREVRPFLLIHL